MTYHCLLAAVALVIGCERESDNDRYKRKAHEAWVGPCKDTATLIATTTWSPSERSCPNRLHRMRVEVAAAPSNEEFGAVVFCECQRGWRKHAADGGAP